jgi:tripartite-type tricarboxylate transporter receptor subunit TctC
MKKILMFVMSALALGGAPATSWSQAYPNRAIKMIVPFPPAGAADVTARIVAKALSEDLGQPIIIDNRGGADGAIAGSRGPRKSLDDFIAKPQSSGTHCPNRTRSWYQQHVD